MDQVIYLIAIPLKQWLSLAIAITAVKEAMQKTIIVVGDLQV